MPRQLVRTSMLVTALALVAGAPVAEADLKGSALTIIARNTNGDEATFEVPPPDGFSSSWIWSTNAVIEMRAEKTGNLVATINPNREETSVEYIGDPVIGMAFSVQAGAFPTTFSIASALLSFPQIGAPEGRASAAITSYNGFAGTQSGTTFAEIVPATSADPFSSNSASASVPAGPGFQVIGVPIDDISSFVHFTLTANDLASGTNVYVVQQRPTPVAPTTWSRIKALAQ